MYFKSLKDWNKNKEKYHGKPQAPRYKKKGSCNTVLFTNQNSKLKGNILTLSKDIKITLPNYHRLHQATKYCGVRVVPKSDSEVTLSVMYEVPEVENSKSKKFAAIDLGVDNIISMVVDNSKPILISGKQLKSKNQRTAKLLSFYKSAAEKKNKKKTTKRIRRIQQKHNRQVKDICHKVTRKVVN